MTEQEENARANRSLLIVGLLLGTAGFTAFMEKVAIGDFAKAHSASLSASERTDAKDDAIEETLMAVAGIAGGIAITLGARPIETANNEAAPA